MSSRQNTENLWDLNRGKIRSRKGGWLMGRGVVNQGYEMMEDFVGKLTYMQVVIFNATGKMPSKNLADWFEGVYICLSWPDARIWCNHIGALGGTMRASVVASTVAGVVATDARSYGIKPILEGLEFIQSAKRDIDNGTTVEEIVRRECKRHRGKPQMMGYARPVAKGDERVPALENLRIELGLPQGNHLKLAISINNYISEHFDESMNINGYVSAFLSDQGFTPEEAYRIFAVVVASGVTACYVDTNDKPAESFFPLACEDMDYNGVPARSVPSE